MAQRLTGLSHSTVSRTGLSHSTVSRTSDAVPAQAAACSDAAAAVDPPVVTTELGLPGGEAFCESYGEILEFVEARLEVLRPRRAA